MYIYIYIHVHVWSLTPLTSHAQNKLANLLFVSIFPPVLRGAGTCDALGICLLTMKSDFGFLVSEISPEVPHQCTQQA